MQKEKSDIFGVWRIWVMSALFFLLHSCCIPTRVRNCSAFPLFSQSREEAIRMQQEKIDISGVWRSWVLSSLFFLLHPGGILTGFRECLTFPLFFRNPVRMLPGCLRKGWYVLGLKDLSLVVIVSPAASWLHPNGISKIFKVSAFFQSPVQMHRGWNRKKWYVWGLEDSGLVVIVFPFASWSHPNRISIFSAFPLFLEILLARNQDATRQDWYFWGL